MKRFLAALCAWLLGVAPATAAPPNWSSGVFSGRAGNYIATGVHFDWTSIVAVASAIQDGGGTVADTSKFTQSIWLRGNVGDATRTVVQHSIWGVEYASNQPLQGTTSAEGQPGIGSLNTDNAVGYGTIRANSGNADAKSSNTAVQTCDLAGGAGNRIPADNLWHNLLFTVDGSVAYNESKYANLLLDGTSVATGCVFDTAVTNASTINGGTGVYAVGTITTNSIIHVGDYLVGTGIPTGASAPHITSNISGSGAGSTWNTTYSGSNIASEQIRLTNTFNANVGVAQGWALMNGGTASGGFGEAGLADVYVNMTETILNGGAGGSNTVNADDIARFVSAGAPVNPGTNCQNMSPTSRQPEICFMGDGHGGGLATWQTNKGTVNNLVTTGQIISPALDEFSPSSGQPAHTVIIRGAYSQSVSNGTTGVTDNDGITINVGDILILALAIPDVSAIDHALTCPTNFNQTLLTRDSGSNDPMNTIVCDGVVDGTNIATTGIYTWNWTTNSTRGGSSTLLVLHGAASSSYIEAAAATKNGSVSSVTTASCPSVTATASNDTLITMWFQWDNWNSGKTWTPPATGGIRIHAYTNTPGMGMADEVLTSSGATGTRSYTSTGTNNLRGICVSLLVKPS
jgi:hypothetical protein